MQLLLQLAHPMAGSICPDGSLCFSSALENGIYEGAFQEEHQGLFYLKGKVSFSVSVLSDSWSRGETGFMVTGCQETPRILH